MTKEINNYQLEKSMKKAFEKWFVMQFGNDKKPLLEGFDDGYTNEIVNGMWIGFNAGGLAVRQGTL